MKSGICLIVNLINNKYYIGSAVDFSQRWREHRSALNREIHKNKYLQSTWNKYGEENFGFSILEECCIENLLTREQFWLDYTKCWNREIGYNLNPTAGSLLGFRHTEQSKKKMAIAQTGKKMASISIAKTVAGNTGKKRTPEQKARMSAAQKGKTFSIETRALMSKVRTGKIRSKESIKKLKATHLLKLQIRDTYDYSLWQ